MKYLLLGLLFVPFIAHANTDYCAALVDYKVLTINESQAHCEQVYNVISRMEGLELKQPITMQWRQGNNFLCGGAVAQGCFNWNLRLLEIAENPQTNSFEFVLLHELSHAQGNPHEGAADLYAYYQLWKIYLSDEIYEN